MMQDRFNKDSNRLLSLERKFKLAVVIATYNRGKSLKSLLDSLMSEMEENDLIVIADASDLEMKEPLNLDSRCLIVKNNSKGVTQNRNIGLDHLNKYDYDYWCFLDDDVIILPGYFKSVRKIIATIDSNTAITGSLDFGLLPKLPDWLGFYRKNALTDDGYLRMPHSIGVWIPRISSKFLYKSKFRYGYDELELKDYIFKNKLRIQFFPQLVVCTDKNITSTAKNQSNLDLNKARIIQNYKYKYSSKAHRLRKIIFLYLTIFHLIFSGDEESRLWSISMFMNPKQMINWLKYHSD